MKYIKRFESELKTTKFSDMKGKWVGGVAVIDKELIHDNIHDILDNFLEFKGDGNIIGIYIKPNSVVYQHRNKSEVIIDNNFSNVDEAIEELYTLIYDTSDIHGVLPDREPVVYISLRVESKDYFMDSDIISDINTIKNRLNDQDIKTRVGFTVYDGYYSLELAMS